VAVFTILGAMLQGDYVMKTISKGIVKANLDYVAIILALICSGFFVTLTIFYRIPTSTSQAIVGGMLGIGLSANAKINHGKLITIVESWVVCPLSVMILAFVPYYMPVKLLRKMEKYNIAFQRHVGIMAI
jgi:PiT family inorganic phosphate transporter